MIEIGFVQLQAPEPIGIWAPHVYVASEHGFMCIQPGIYYEDQFPQDEDCLYLNIYVPGKQQKYFPIFEPSAVIGQIVTFHQKSRDNQPQILFHFIQLISMDHMKS